MFFTLPYPLRSVLGLIQGTRFSVLEIFWVFGLVIALAVILILLYHSTCKSRLKSDHDWLVDLQKHTIPALNYGKPESEQVTLGLEIAICILFVAHADLKLTLEFPKHPIQTHGHVTSARQKVFELREEVSKLLHDYIENLKRAESVDNTEDPGDDKNESERVLRPRPQPDPTF